MKTKCTKYLKRSVSLLATVALLLSQAGYASARIIFQDDTLHYIPSTGLQLNYGGGAGTKAAFTLSSGDLTIDAEGGDIALGSSDNFSLSGLLTGTAGATLSGAAINLNASSNFATNIGTGTTTAAVTVGGGSNTVEIASSSWDISTTGVASGLTGITTTGVVDVTGAEIAGASPLVLEGSTANGFETTIAVTDPTVDRTITLPDATGEVSLLGQTIANSEMVADTIDWDSISNAMTLDEATDIDLQALTLSTSGTGALDFNSTGAVTFAGAVTAESTLAATGATNLNGAVTLGDAAADVITVTGTVAGASPLVFEGSTADGFETTLAVTDPGADYTITLPAITGTLVTTGDTGTVTTTMITDDSILEVDLDATNAPTDNYILSFDNATGGFTWVDPAVGDAGTLDGLDSLQFLRSDTSDAFTSGTLTMNAGTTLDVDGSADFTGAEILGASPLVFEGSTADGFETTLAVTDPGADYTITLPAITGTLVTTGDTATVDATMLGANSVQDSEMDYTTVTLADFTNDLALTSAQIFVGNGSNVATGVAMSGDVNIDNTGAATIQANAVALATDTTGNYVATVADAGNSVITVANSGTENAAVTLDITADGVDDTHIDWGTGANQVSGGDVPLADSGGYFTTDEVESALQELGGQVGSNAKLVEAVTLNPEYPNAVYTVGASQGKLESIIDGTVQAYKWTTQQASSQTMDITTRFELPDDFSSATSITVAYKTADGVTASNTVAAALSNITDAATDCDTATAAASATWATLTLNSFGTCSLNSGDTLEVSVTLDSKNATAVAYAGEIELNYSN